MVYVNSDKRTNIAPKTAAAADSTRGVNGKTASSSEFSTHTLLPLIPERLPRYIIEERATVSVQE